MSRTLKRSAWSYDIRSGARVLRAFARQRRVLIERMREPRREWPYVAHRQVLVRRAEERAARNPMQSQGADASRAAYPVGYEGVPQFTREYGRMFGKPPVTDARESRARVGDAA
ncbi:MAG: hypothetical protein ACTHK2_06260 [Dokdonella sp.]|uniref:hypothetical protein n=1 Tax=Dokdonella sp. TaxID=2291710 RepID=UPI003F7F1BA2